MARLVPRWHDACMKFEDLPEPLRRYPHWAWNAVIGVLTAGALIFIWDFDRCPAEEPSCGEAAALIYLFWTAILFAAAMVMLAIGNVLIWNTRRRREVSLPDGSFSSHYPERDR